MNSLGVRSIGGITLIARCSAESVRGTSSFLRDPVLRVTGLARSAACLACLRYSHMPSRPPSRPNPLSRYPPNPADASNRFVELIHTTPLLSFGAMSSARLMLSVHTLAARPYGELLASATDSSGVRNVIVTSTGPKISTCAIVLDGVTSVNNVGG